jgi:hypothetical protein
VRNPCLRNMLNTQIELLTDVMQNNDQMKEHARYHEDYRGRYCLLMQAQEALLEAIEAYKQLCDS